MSPLTDPLGPDLKATPRALKLGKLTATLPQRLTLPRQNNMPHAAFLQLVLPDEVARREAGSITLRARNAGLDPAMRTETWDPTASVRYDQQLWNELVSLRFLDGPHGALILGPVGVGKTHLATALGHIAVRRRRTVQQQLLCLQVDCMECGLRCSLDCRAVATRWDKRAALRYSCVCLGSRPRVSWDTLLANVSKNSRQSRPLRAVSALRDLSSDLLTPLGGVPLFVEFICFPRISRDYFHVLCA